MIQRIDAPDRRAAIAQEVLATLPDWFGLPESTAAYVRACRGCPLWAEVDETGQVLGFISLKATSPYAGEIHVMGIKPAYHRQGIGKRLYEALRTYAISQGMEYLQVKTVQEGRYDEYDCTNAFYRALGFRELECLPTLWDECNPCQLYIQAL